VTLPGVQTTGYASDYGGTRSVFGQVADTGSDAYCARAIVVVDNSSVVNDLTACDGQNLTYQTGRFTGTLSVFAYIAARGGHPITGNLVTVPSSSDDPELRALNVGAQWEYYASNAFHYKVQRPGVLVEGYGANQWDGSRSAGSYVQHTGGANTCAYGDTRDNTKRADGYTCTPGGVAYFSGFFPGEITVDACAWYPYRCLSTVIVQPDR
jgi:hypothetical protein